MQYYVSSIHIYIFAYIYSWISYLAVYWVITSILEVNAFLKIQKFFLILKQLLSEVNGKWTIIDFAGRSLIMKVTAVCSKIVLERAKLWKLLELEPTIIVNYDNQKNSLPRNVSCKYHALSSMHIIWSVIRFNISFCFVFIYTIFRICFVFIYICSIVFRLKITTLQVRKVTLSATCCWLKNVIISSLCLHDS